MTARDWRAWHDAYDQPETSLARRLAVVRARISEALDAAPPGPVRAISMCAGQGRDLIPVLAGHPRGHDVTARLVELDPDNAEVARRSAHDAGLGKVEVVTGDAGVTAAYRGIIPAGLVLACGVFGNISDSDIERTIDCCAAMAAPGATVVWTRHRAAPDKVPWICESFSRHGFGLRWLSEPHLPFGVGVHRFAGETGPLDPAARIFTFTGRGSLPEG